MEEPKKPAWKTKGQEGLSSYYAFIFCFIIAVLIVASTGDTETDDVSTGHLCCFGTFLVLSIIYLAMGLTSTTKNLIYSGRRAELTEQWKTYEKEHSAFLRAEETGKKRASLQKKQEAAGKAAETRRKNAEAKARKLPIIICRVEKSGNAYRAWSTEGDDHTPDITSSTRRKALEGNYLLGQFKSSRGHKSWRRITATVLKNLGGKRNIVFEDPKEEPKELGMPKNLRKTKSKDSASLVLGEIKDDMSPEMKAFMGSYKDWKDDGGVIPENSDEILEEILENEKSGSSSNSRSKNCEHCGFSNSADNNPGWAGLCSPAMASMLEGSAGCDISCVNCGLNFWVSTKELTGSGSDVQFKSMSGIGDYMVNQMNEMAEEEGDSRRYELPTERAKGKSAKKKVPAKKRVPAKKKVPAKTSASTSLKSKLKDAKDLFDEGLIDEEEYKQMKKDIINP